jgi:hypothetical protein
MEMSPGNYLNSYLKQTKMPFLSFTKSENRRAEQVLSEVEEGTSGRGMVGKRCRRVSMVQIL